MTSLFSFTVYIPRNVKPSFFRCIRGAGRYKNSLLNAREESTEIKERLFDILSILCEKNCNFDSSNIKVKKGYGTHKQVSDTFRKSSRRVFYIRFLFQFLSHKKQWASFPLKEVDSDEEKSFDQWQLQFF